MKTQICFFICLFCWQFAFAQSIDFQPIGASWQTVLNKAKAENKPIFLHFDEATANYTSDQEKAFREAAEKPSLAMLYNAQFVCHRMSSYRSEAFVKQFGIETPYLISALYFDANGMLLHVSQQPFEKFDAVDFYQKAAKTALDPEKNLTGQFERFDRGSMTDVKELEKLSQNAKMSGFHNKAETIALFNLKKQERSWLTRENVNAIFRYAEQLDGEMFQFMLKNRPSFDNFLSAEAVETKIKYKIDDIVNSRFINPSTKELRFAEAKTYIEKYLPPTEATKIVSTLRIEYYDLKKDKLGKAEALMAHAEKYPPTSSTEFHTLAWEVADASDNPIWLEKALNWSLESVRITPQYPFLKTTAWIYFRMGKKAEAQYFMEKAMNKAKETGETLKDGAELKAKIAGM